MVLDRELDIDLYIEEHRQRGVLRGDNTVDGYFHRVSEYHHAINVTQAVIDLSKDAVELGGRFCGRDIEVHLCLGLGRRIKFIWRSLRELLEHASPLRKQPMTLDDTEWVAMRLNEIYINLRGCLDNLAWALVDLFDCQAAAMANRVTVSIFHPKFAVRGKSPETAKVATDFENWNRLFSDRRDPAAHRIPLLVPNTIHDKRSATQAEQILLDIDHNWKQAVNGDEGSKGAEESLSQIASLFSNFEGLGEFRPVFVHDPKAPSERLYPTVPNDAAALVRISKRVFEIIKSHSG